MHNIIIHILWHFKWHSLLLHICSIRAVTIITIKNNNFDTWKKSVCSKHTYNGRLREVIQPLNTFLCEMLSRILQSNVFVNEALNPCQMFPVRNATTLSLCRYVQPTRSTQHRLWYSSIPQNLWEIIFYCTFFCFTFVIVLRIGVAVPMVMCAHVWFGLCSSLVFRHCPGTGLLLTCVHLFFI